MLGTNDCKTRYGASAGVIARGLEQIIRKAIDRANSDFKLIVISPIHLGIGVGEEGYDSEFDAKSEMISKKLADEYKIIADKYHAVFIDCASIAKSSDIDREHLDENGHWSLSEAIYKEIIEKND